MRRLFEYTALACSVTAITICLVVLLLRAGGCAKHPATPTWTPVVTTERPPSPSPTATAIPQKPTLTHTPTPTATAEPTATPSPTHTATPGPVWVEVDVPYEMSAWFRSCPSVGCVSIYPVNTVHDGQLLLFQQCANPAGFVWVEVYNGTTGYVYSDYIRPDVCRIR